MSLFYRITPPIWPVLLALLLAGCDHPNNQSAVVIPEVGVITLTESDVALTTELPGRTSSYRIAEIRPQVSGILQRRLFDEGSMIDAGQVLYQIDAAPYRATLAKAEASLESSRLLAQRYERLVKTNAISQQDRDDARSSWLQAQASVDSARIDLGYTKIIAPISGRIGRSSVTQGALLTANQTDALATIQQLDPIYVDIPQSSTALWRLQDDLSAGRLKRSGDQMAEVQLLLDNGTEYPYTGRLKFAEVTVDEGTDSVIIRALFPNPEGRLLPGMFVRARLQEGVRERALLVPQRGITRSSSGQATVLVVDGNHKVVLKEVATERVVGNRWLISSGLALGDRVIIDGVQKAIPGSEVRVVDAKLVAPDATTIKSQLQ
ncbi:efflux RND transporter periplasmic adaptor subunit [Acerihabitans arboris]|uniref:Efflux RND transporter periplasmic adaptor subunit n=1 Tax=Acerihabitans arboris TaxID=2691583 RepID=A0A845STP4_9GAMM|nr:efflux RND transporter periplasmic adaptor subunit [Acerihabitans arboris]NDL65841.1 efflux RND transporter periplasmic adaptor subunit [Acerihabitans arboris]